jgi:hypothetical protein
VHDTPKRRANLAGDRWTDQFMPFQRSTTPVPTAVQALAELHETPAGSPVGDPGGRMVGWTDQLLPFQRAAMPDPTAAQAVGDTHDTLAKLPPAPASAGAGSVDQLAPSQCSTTAVSAWLAKS